MRELATVRDLFKVLGTCDFDLGLNDTLTRITVLDYTKEAPIYKDELEKVVDDILNAATKFDKTKGLNYTNVYEYNANELKNNLLNTQAFLIHNDLNFCRFYVCNDYMTYEESKMLSSLNTQNTNIIYFNKTIKENLQRKKTDIEVVIKIFKDLIKHCYSYIDSITDISEKLLLYLFRVAINQNNNSCQKNANKSTAKEMQQIYELLSPKIKECSNLNNCKNLIRKNFQEDVVKPLIIKTEMIYKSESDENKLEQIQIKAYNLILDEIPYIPSLEEVNFDYDNLSDFLNEIYYEELHSEKPLRFYIDPNDLKYYPHWLD